MFENIQCFCHLISINMQSDLVSVIFCIYQLALNWSCFALFVHQFLFSLFKSFSPSNILISKVPFEFEGTNISYSHFFPSSFHSPVYIFFCGLILFCSGSSLLHVCFFCRFTALKSVLSIQSPDSPQQTQFLHHPRWTCTVPGLLELG